MLKQIFLRLLEILGILNSGTPTLENEVLYPSNPESKLPSPLEIDRMDQGKYKRS
jgi:hypothetical protein